MARFDRVFGRLVLNYRSPLTEWYRKHLYETKEGFEGSPHVLWTGWVGPTGFPRHRIGNKLLPLNGYLLYKGEGFALASDEVIVTICGELRCCQTAHFRVLPKAQVQKDLTKP